MVYPESFCTLVPEKPDQEDCIQESTGSLGSGKTSVKENEGKKSSRPSEPSGTSNTTSEKRTS